MTYRVTISAQADADLRGIYEHIAFKLRSTINAAGQLDRLEKVIRVMYGGTDVKRELESNT